MKVAIRADASRDIGTGHIMRCLTLSDRLYSAGVEVIFLCRPMEGNLIAFIRSRGYTVNVLPALDPKLPVDTFDGLPAHQHWLGTSMDADAGDVINALGTSSPDWLIVDHYAIDHRWETKMRRYCQRIMVIDDLADRHHDCDFLLDQSLGRMAVEYLSLVPADCRIATGPAFALLRDDFAILRQESLSRRRAREVKSILITMGGIDKANATSKVLDALPYCRLGSDTRFTIVMGGQSPWLVAVREHAASLRWTADIIVDTPDMAVLMSESDLAIGAAGATSWERCCLGLPSVMMVLADNQTRVANNLEKAGAARTVSDVNALERLLPLALDPLVESWTLRSEMINAAAAITDGHGTARVLDLLEI